MLDHDKIKEIDAALLDATVSATTQEGYKYLDKALSYLRLAVRWEQAPDATIRGIVMDDLNEIANQQGE